MCVDQSYVCCAHGQRCGKWTRLPALWLGSRVLRFTDLDDLGQLRAEEIRPARSGAHAPGHAVGDSKQRLVDSPPVLEHEARRSLTVSMDRALVIHVVLATLDDKSIDRSHLQHADDVRQGARASLELGDAVASTTDHDQ